MSKQIILPKIEKDVPIPGPRKPRNRRPYISPWLEILRMMDVGDSVVIPTFRTACFHANAARLGYVLHVEKCGKMVDPNDWFTQRGTPREFAASRVWVRSKPTVEVDILANQLRRKYIEVKSVSRGCCYTRFTVGVQSFDIVTETSMKRAQWWAKQFCHALAVMLIELRK